MPQPPLSPYIEKNGLIFLSGQIHLGADGKLVEADPATETRQALDNLAKILAQANLSFSDLVKVTIYLTDMTNYGAVNEVYATYFQAPYPAREVVCVKALPLGARIEISAVAMR